MAIGVALSRDAGGSIDYLCGRARDRVYEISTTDPVPWRIIDAYLDADPGYKPQERLAHTYGKVT